MLWGYWRRTASNSGSPSRLVCRSPYRCKPIQKPIKGAHHRIGGEPYAYDPPSSEGSDTDKKETIYEYKIHLDVRGQRQPFT